MHSDRLIRASSDVDVVDIEKCLKLHVYCFATLFSELFRPSIRYVHSSVLISFLFIN